MHAIAATGGKDGSARIWGLAEAEPIGAPPRHPAATAVTAVALSDDGRRLAAAAAESVGVWEVADGTLAAEIPVGAPVTAVAFAPGGARVAIGDAAGKVTFASIAGEAGQATLRGDAAIAALAVAAGGDLLVTGDAAGGVQLWRLAGGAPLGAAQRLPQPPRWLAFDSAGVTLLAGTDRWVHGFTVGPDGLGAAVRASPACGCYRSPWPERIVRGSSASTGRPCCAPTSWTSRALCVRWRRSTRLCSSAIGPRRSASRSIPKARSCRSTLRRRKARLVHHSQRRVSPTRCTWRALAAFFRKFVN